MSFHRWLDRRDPAPPPTLAARLRDAIDAFPAPDQPIHALALDGGVRVLDSLLRQPNATRSAAIDLLAADALVTYAFESAAENGADLDLLARDAMHRIARLADGER